MTTRLKEKTLNYLQTVRIVSVTNMALALDTAAPDLFPILESLQAEQIVRFAKGCSDCSSDCATGCGSSSQKKTIHENTIVISLIKPAEVN